MIKNGFIRRFFSSLIAIFLLSSCSSPVFSDDVNAGMKEHYLKKGENWLEEKDQIDPKGNLSREDYYHTFHDENNPYDKEDKTALDLPDVSQMIIAPDAPVVDNDKLVTLSVTEDIPLKEVLVELARRADIDIEIDPNIDGGIIFRAKDKPFSEVIERVAKLAGLRYKIENGVLKVEKDDSYVLNYRMNILNLTRKSQSSLNITTSLTAAGGTGGGGGIGAGSASSLSSDSGDGDIWKTIEDGVNGILKSTSPAAAQGASAAGTNPSIVSLNRQAGIISVYANQKQHKLIKEYLDYIQLSVSSQVLIEAKVLEVSLKDEYRTGIDWNLVNNNDGLSKFRIRFDETGDTSSLANNKLTIGKLSSEFFGVANTSIQSSVSMMESFGTVRTLSSPRLNAMNNQAAVLSFAQNFVYFDVTIEEETDSDAGTSTTTVDAEPQTVPVGVMLTLQPSIDLERNEIVMNVRPTLSRIVDSVENPGVALQAASIDTDLDISSAVPVVEKRELDSVLRLKSGEVMVIGGLMDERVENTDRGVPGLSKVPVLGNAFKSVKKSSSVVETVVFIKATIVPSKGVSVEDKELYKKFTRDRRPLQFNKTEEEAGN